MRGVAEGLEGIESEGKSGRHADAVLGVTGFGEGVMGWSVLFRVYDPATNFSPSFIP